MRNLIHKPKLSRIDLLDQRFYCFTSENGNESYFPSVTEILSIYPKGHGFEQWLKDVGNNASGIADRAAEAGTKIHGAAELLNAGQELSWIDEKGNPAYTLQEWEMLLRYSDFWKKCTPLLVANELNMVSPILQFGGTLDMIVMIGSQRWLIDIKTSNYLHKSYELQLSAYAALWNEQHPDEAVEYTGILWLKAATRSEKIDVAKHIYQGQGWQIKTYERHYQDAFKIFGYTQNIWQEENPNYKPANKIYTDKIQLSNIPALKG